MHRVFAMISELGAQSCQNFVKFLAIPFFKGDGDVLRKQ